MQTWERARSDVQGANWRARSRPESATFFVLRAKSLFKITCLHASLLLNHSRSKLISMSSDAHQSQPQNCLYLSLSVTECAHAAISTCHTCATTSLKGLQGTVPGEPFQFQFLNLFHSNGGPNKTNFPHKLSQRFETLDADACNCSDAAATMSHRYMKMQTYRFQGYHIIQTKSIIQLNAMTAHLICPQQAIVTACVLQQQQLSSGAQHSGHLFQGSTGLGEHTEAERIQHSVKRCVREREGGDICLQRDKTYVSFTRTCNQDQLGPGCVAPFVDVCINTCFDAIV